MMQRAVSLPRSAPPPAWERARVAIDDGRQRLADPVTRPALLWRVLWAPYWLWADAPVPELPHRSAPVPADLGLAGQAVVAGIDRVRRRLWLSQAAAAV